MMALNQDFLLGFVSGTVVGAVGYRHMNKILDITTLTSTDSRITSASIITTAFLRRACCTKRKIRGFNCRTTDELKKKKVSLRPWL